MITLKPRSVRISLKRAFLAISTFALLVAPLQALLFVLVPKVAHASPASMPLHVSADSRRLEDASGNPFLIVGDAAWSLLVGPDQAGAEQYLDARRAKGFNTIKVNLVEHKYNGPTNAYGQDPFLTPGDFSTPNEAYFQNVDWVLNKAAEKGFLVLLFPAYLGVGGGSDGWYQEVNANGETKMGNYGRYIGERYKNNKNIMWVMGGDYDAREALPEVRAMVQGIEEKAGPQLFSVHNFLYESGVTKYPDENWIDVNTTYSDCVRTPQQSLDDYNRAGPIPYFYIEGSYENEGSNNPICHRSQAYWPILSGSTGANFGNRPIWLFADGWQDALNSTGANSMMHVSNLFASRPWHELVPDQTHTTLTAGYGSLSGATYAPAARTANGNTFIAYTPSQRALTVDMTRISGSQATAWWYNPATGATTNIGTYATTGSQDFTPPAAGDWVLVIDNAALSLPAPGTMNPDTTAPSVQVTAPTDQQTITGSVALTATAADDRAVANVTFYADGVQVGAPDTTAPYSESLDTTTLANGTHAITAVARDTSGNTTTSTAVTVTVDNPVPTPPSIALTSPTSGSTVSGAITLAADASDDQGVANVTFYVDSAQIGSPVTSAPYTMPLDTSSLTDGSHIFSATARDIYDVTTNSSVTATTHNPDTTAPAVNITAPAASATVAGNVTVSANASDNKAVTGVTFYANGTQIGAEDTTSPYSVTWNVASLTGPYQLTAVARDAAGNSTTSAAVQVTVSNPPPSSGLLAAYGFNNTSNPKADTSPQANHLTCATCPAYSATGGRLGGGAYNFAGNNNWLTIPNESQFDFSTNMTVSFWMKTNSGFTKSWETFVAKGDSAWGVTRYGSTANASFTTFSPTPQDLRGTATLSTNTWKHVTVTYDGTTKKLYTDGVLDASIAYNKVISKNNLNVRLGFNEQYAAGDYTGWLDDVRIYNRALTQAEVQTDMNTPVN